LSGGGSIVRSTNQLGRTAFKKFQPPNPQTTPKVINKNDKAPNQGDHNTDAEVKNRSASGIRKRGTKKLPGFAPGSFLI
jgi:hypothetical protein